MSIIMNNRVEIKSLLLSKGLPLGSYAYFNHERIILKSNAMGLFLFIRMQTDARA